MISKEERKARHKAVEYAKASVGLEGYLFLKDYLILQINIFKVE